MASEPSVFALWQIDLFGVLQVHSLREPNAQPSQRFRTQMTGSLLAYLAYYKGQPQPREVLLDQFWPDVDVKLSRGRLSVALSSLRAQFSSPSGQPELLIADNFTVTLDPLLIQTDVAIFRDRLRRARRARLGTERRVLLGEAVRFYTGDLLSGRYDPWIVVEQERLREQFEQARAELEALRPADTPTAPSRRGSPVSPAPLVTATKPTPLIPLIGTYTVVLLQGRADALRRTLQAAQGYSARELILNLVDRGYSRADNVENVDDVDDAALRCLAFASAPAALRYVLVAQSATQNTLRVAVDTGFLDELQQTSDGEETIPPLLASLTRLVEITYPGQILCTEATAALVRNAPAISSTPSLIAPRQSGGALRLRDLGPFRLEAEETARRVFQVEDATAPPQFFAPLQALSGYAPSLPSASTRFFGREKEIAQLVSMLTGVPGARENIDGSTRAAPSSAFVSLIGLGGIGKTRLALESATAVQEAFKGRVWFVALSEVQEAERIPDAIRDALRLPKDPLLDPLEQCIAFLSSNPLAALLVIDNAEPFLAPLISEDGTLRAESHAMPLISRVLQALCESVPSLAFLVTSRQMLGVAGERAFPVGPLLRSRAAAQITTQEITDLPTGWASESETHDANESIEATLSEGAICVRLFEDRARAIRPDFHITEASFPTVLRLCAALDGIPLAIELAAARTGLLSPSQMLTQLENRFALLKSSRRGVPERHRSLWAIVDSTYQLLPDTLKHVFAQLSVFRGGWTLDAVRALCFDTSFDMSNDMSSSTDTGQNELESRMVDSASAMDALEAIAELHEYSLVFTVSHSSTLSAQPDQATPRFQMLDTLRQYAADQLKGQNETERTVARHETYFAHLIAEAEPHLRAGERMQQEWLDTLEADHDNLRAALDAASSPRVALRMAVGLHRFWLIRGHVAEGCRRLTACVKAARADTRQTPGGKGAPQSELATAYNALGILTWATGAMPAANEYFHAALSYYRAGGEESDVARILNNLGIVASQSGNFAEARHSYEQSLTIYRRLGDALHQSMVLTNLGGVLVYLEDFDAARRLLEESLPIQRAAGDDFSVLRTVQNIGEVALRQNDLDAAGAALLESLSLRRTLGDQSVFSDTLSTAAILLTQLGAMPEAAVAWAASSALRAASSSVPAPTNAKYEQSWIARIQQALPEGEYAAMCRKGSAMDFEQAAAFLEAHLQK